MTYLDLENLHKETDREVCLFGAGKFGKIYAYELLKAAGVHVDFYCDNNVPEGTVIRDGIKVREIRYLFENKDNIRVF